MAKSKHAKRYPKEFHRQMVELHRAGRTLSELSREFGCSQWAISRWVKQAIRNEEETNHSQAYKLKTVHEIGSTPERQQMLNPPEAQALRAAVRMRNSAVHSGADISTTEATRGVKAILGFLDRLGY